MLFLRKRLIMPMFRQQLARYFSQQQNKDSSQIDERAERAKQIEFRKRMMEENQVKMMRESIENTKGQFSPLVQYIKLFKKQLFYFTVFGFFALSMIIAWKVVGVYEDPFTKRKKIVIVSDEFEKSLEKNLRQTFVSHFGTTQKPYYLFKQSYQLFQATFKKLTGRDYRLVLVSAQDNVVIVLPGTIILSRKAMLSNADDLLRVLILTQALFAKKSHIKDLALGNVIHFLTHWIKPSNVSDINMLKIYSKPFTKQQIQETINEISKHHHNQPSQLSSEQIRKSLLKMIEQQSKNASRFSLKTRMQAMVPQE